MTSLGQTRVSLPPQRRNEEEEQIITTGEHEFRSYKVSAAGGRYEHSAGAETWSSLLQKSSWGVKPQAALSLGPPDDGST